MENEQAMTTPAIGLTPRSRDALKLATKEMKRLGHHVVGPEHLTLGVLAEGTGLGAGILTRLGVDLPAFRAAVEKAAVAASDGESTPFGKLSPETRQVLSTAQDEARRLNHPYIGQEHILLALLKQQGSVAQVLAEYDVTVDKVEFQVLLLIGGTSAEPSREELKRYNLALPESLFRQVVRVADREHTTVLEVIRRSVKLGLLVAEAQEAGAKLVIRDGTTEREIVIL